MMKARRRTRKNPPESPETDKQEDTSESAAPVYDNAPDIALPRKTSPVDHCRCQ